MSSASDWQRCEGSNGQHRCQITLWISRPSCGGYLKVGGADVVRVGLAEMRGFQRSASMSNHSVDLTPGFYQAEYIFFCPSWAGVRQARYSIRWRDENDATPRDFSPAELFHLER